MSSPNVRIPNTLSAYEWRCISEFKLRAVQLGSASSWKSNSPLRAKVALTADRRVTCDVEGMPAEESLCSLLMSFRFFFGNDQPSNLNRVLNILGKHCRDDRLGAVLGSLRLRWKHALFRNAMQLSFNGKPLSAARILDLWLNAHYFHSDLAKRETLETVSRMLTPQFLKYMLVEAVIEGSRVVFSTYDMLRELEVP